MSGRNHIVQTGIDAGNKGAVFGFAQGDPLALTVQYPDHRAVGLELGPSSQAQIAVRGAGLDFLDVNIGIIDGGGRQPPCQILIPARPDRGNSRNCRPDRAARCQFQPCQIEQARHGQRRLRVIGQQRAIRRRPVA